MNASARPTPTLHIRLQGFWHPGTGRAMGAAVDAAAYRDPDGLPALPGRHLKGLLRNACERAAAWGWPGFDDALVAALFGDRPETVAAGQIPRPGCLRVGDARLPEALRATLAAPESRALRQALFRVLLSTAIDPETGTADDRTLRGVEVVVPLDLCADLSPLPGTQPPQDWIARLRQVLPLIPAVGAHRTRGLGRAVLELSA